MEIILIAAVAENGVIGRKNDLPWHLPDDLKFFKEQTLNQTVVMGRKNYLSIPEKFRPLPKRNNIVMSRQPDFTAEGCHLAQSAQGALAISRSLGSTQTWIIGGAEIYNLFLKQANRMYITRVHDLIEGDVFFPEYDTKDWQVKCLKTHFVDEKHAHAFSFLEFIRKAQN